MNKIKKNLDKSQEEKETDSRKGDIHRVCKNAIKKMDFFTETTTASYC